MSMGDNDLYIISKKTCAYMKLVFKSSNQFNDFKKDNFSSSGKFIILRLEGFQGHGALRVDCPGHFL